MKAFFKNAIVWSRFPQRHIRRARAWGTVIEVSIGWSIPDGRAASGASTCSESTGKVSRDVDSAITTAVLWLDEQGLDLRCVRLQAYLPGERGIFDIQQLMPLPQAAD